MAMASTFGSDDFYSEAISRIALVRKAERFSPVKTYLFGTLISSPAQVVVRWLTQNLVRYAIKYLDKRTANISSAGAWFENEFQEYEKTIGELHRIPSSEFLVLLARLQVANGELLAGCRENVAALRKLNPTSRVADAFARLAVQTARLELVVERYLELGRAAQNSRLHLRALARLDRDFDAVVHALPKDDEEFDPELVALADLAIERIKDRQHP